MVKDGYKFALPLLALGALAFWAGWWWGGLLLVLLAGFVVYFFRDPERLIPTDLEAIVSPADGRVIEVIEEGRNGQAGQRVSIFLSVFDVHVNRVPWAGKIEKMEYRRGRFLAAMRAQASLENEQNVIEFATRRGPVVVKQVAGLIARRILCWKSPGDEVVTGERLGMIRFGSRVDIWLPAGADLLVRRGQHVAGGSTILARWK